MLTNTPATFSTKDEAAEFLIVKAGRCGTVTGISPTLKAAVLDRSMLAFIWTRARKANQRSARVLMQIDDARAVIEGRV